MKPITLNIKLLPSTQHQKEVSKNCPKATFRILLYVAFVALNLQCFIATESLAIPATNSPVVQQLHQWLQGPIRIEVRNEVNGIKASFESKPTLIPANEATAAHALDALGLSVTERFSATERGMAWDLEFSGQDARAGHEVTIELPLLTEQRQVFTPGERGLMALAVYPTFKPVEYG